MIETEDEAGRWIKIHPFVYSCFHVYSAVEVVHMDWWSLPSDDDHQNLFLIKVLKGISLI